MISTNKLQVVWQNLALLFVLCIGAAAQAYGPENPATATTVADVLFQNKNSGSLDFIVYGDLRDTDPKDKRNTDPKARRALLGRIAKEHPELLMITGDIVLTGENPDDWSNFDAESKPVRDAGISMFSAIGNHDLREEPQKALPYFFSRFPEAKGKRWFSIDAGPAYFIVLDSQSDESEGSEQGRWLLSQLDHLPATADFVVVVLHHPLYTQARESWFVRDHAVRPEEHHLAEILESRAKSLRQKMLVISGHVHNYERYAHWGVMYLVSGGGGARPVTVSRSANDFYRENGPTYHYIKIHIAEHRLTAEMVKYEDVNGGVVWKLKDRFELAVEK